MSATLATHSPLYLPPDANTKSFTRARQQLSNPASSSHPLHPSETPRTMPDGAQLLQRSSHTHPDSFSTTATSLGMDFNTDYRAQLPPGIFAPVPSSFSRSGAGSGPPGLPRDPSGPSASFPSHSSPPLAHANQPVLAAPRAMQPYPRLTSPQPAGESATGSNSGARSPSPTKRSFNFPMGDPSERWNSIGQVSASAGRGQTITSQRKQSVHGGLSSSNAAEPFLGYNELFSANGANLATSDAAKSANSDPMNVAFRAGSSSDSRAFSLSSSQEQDLMSQRYGLSPGHYGGRDELSSISGNPRSVGNDDFSGRPPYGMSGASGMPNPGNLSPRSMMQLQHQQMQVQSQQQSFHQQHLPLGSQQQHQQLTPAQQQQLGLQGGVGNAAGMPVQGGPPEEITTVFIVGFPDDMTEREFANMFLFARGFEASTLKIPAGMGAVGPNGRLPDGNGPMSTGPGGPYQAVNMPGAGLYDLAGGAGPGWDDQNLPLALSRAGGVDPFSSLASMTGMPNALGGPGAANAAAAAAGKIKQIIGFAKFRTRADALEARDALNGRKVDAEKGCVLKTEMAKKNLHTKQRPVLSAPGFPEGGSGPLQPPSGLGGPIGGANSLQQPPPFALGGPFDPRAGPQMNGPGAQAGPFGPFSKGPGGFEPFNGQSSFAGNASTSTTADLLSPQEMFGGPEFFSQGGPAALRSTIGSSAGLDQQGRPQASSQLAQSQQQQQQQQQQQSSIGDKWGASMGPIDYYGPESGNAPSVASSRGLQGGPSQASNAQGSQRSDWPTVGSPPPGLYSQAPGSNMAPPSQRPTFQRQGSRGTSVGTVGSEQGTGPGFGPGPGSVNKLEEGGRLDSTSPVNNRSGTTSSSAGPEAVATRFGSMQLGSSPVEEDPSSQGAVKPPQQVPSPDLPSPSGRNVLGDNHPPVNTLFVGNLPGNASSAILSQIEDQLRAVFSSCRGFRQFSFRLKSNGPMCFVEFEDVHTAGKAMSELNGHSLGGAIKNGGIRLSFSKNPLFRMNSNTALNGGGGMGVPGSGSSSGSAATPEGGVNAPMSLGSASESLSAATRR